MWEINNKSSLVPGFMSFNCFVKILSVPDSLCIHVRLYVQYLCALQSSLVWRWAFLWAALQQWLSLSVDRRHLPPLVTFPLPSCDNKQCGNDCSDQRPEDPGSQEPLPDLLGLLEVGRQELLNKPLACSGDTQDETVWYEGKVVKTLIYWTCLLFCTDQGPTGMHTQILEPCRTESTLRF